MSRTTHVQQADEAGFLGTHYKMVRKGREITASGARTLAPPMATPAVWGGHPGSHGSFAFSDQGEKGPDIAARTVKDESLFRAYGVSMYVNPRLFEMWTLSSASGPTARVPTTSDRINF